MFNFIKRLFIKDHLTEEVPETVVIEIKNDPKCAEPNNDFYRIRNIEDITVEELARLSFINDLERILNYCNMLRITFKELQSIRSNKIINPYKRITQNIIIDLQNISHHPYLKLNTQMSSKYIAKLTYDMNTAIKYFESLSLVNMLTIDDYIKNIIDSYIKPYYQHEVWTNEDQLLMNFDEEKKDD